LFIVARLTHPLKTLITGLAHTEVQRYHAFGTNFRIGSLEVMNVMTTSTAVPSCCVIIAP